MLVWFLRTKVQGLEKVHFFIDATNGQAYSHNDIETYLNRLGKTADPNYFKPRSNRAIICRLIKELSKCFNNPDHQYKQEELIQLANILEA